MADDICETGCTQEAADLSDTALTRATLSNVFVFAGLGLTALGVVLVLTAPSPQEPAATAALAPAFGPDGAGASLRLTW